jgi:alpha-beta hydrolase superfamily lysophospholipase
MSPLPLFHEWKADRPRALVHVLHGMSEHGGRYERIARELNGLGITVRAHDHRGHGLNMGDVKGHFGDANGWRALIDDAWAVSAAMMQQFPGLPLVLFAHSMGSFIGQTLMAERGASYRAVILSGTNGPPDAKEAALRAYSGLQRAVLGGRNPGKWLDSLVMQKTFNRKFAPNRTNADWLSRCETEVDKYIADPWCNFPLTAQAWFDFLHGKSVLGDKSLLTKIPTAIPVWIMSGSRDPVGEETHGVQRLLEAYADVGMTNVRHKFYSDARHELLNETNRVEVTHDLIAWLNTVLA